MPDPQAIVADILYGRWRSQILYAGVKLGVFEAVSGAARPAAAIAEELKVDPALFYRLLRALGSLGLLQEHPQRCFSLSETGAIFSSGHPQSLRGVALLVEGPEHYAVWKHLPDMVQEGRQNGFVREYGRMGFEHARVTPSYSEAFNEGMSSYSRLQTPWVLDALQAYDFSAFANLCDVGGGQGHLLCHFLLQHPHLQGKVLERAQVIKDRQALWAEKLGLGERCEYIAGDMFVDVPPADAYLMKMVLHDWNDEECIRILKVIQRRTSPDGRIFLVEYVIPDIDTPHFSKLFDIHMLCWGTGQERTTEQYAALLESAGWRFVASWLPSSGTLRVLEGSKV